MAALAPLLSAAKYLPASVVLKGLEKINPKFKNFFTTAASYGLDSNRALEYLTQRFGNPTTQQTENDLEEGAQEGQLRPDEAAAKSQLDNANLPGKALRSIASFGGAGILGGLSGSKEEEQQAADAQAATPQSQMLAGVQQAQQRANQGQQAQRVGSAFNSTIHPQVQTSPPVAPQNEMVSGVKNAQQKLGQTQQAQRAKSLASSVMNPQTPSNPTQPAQQPKYQAGAGLIAQYPELGAYIDQLMKAGAMPEDAAARAKSEKKWQQQIGQIESQAGQDFIDVIKQLFYGFGNQKPGQTQQNGQGASKLIEALQRLQQARAAKGG